MAANGEGNGSTDYVYRISTAKEWEELQSTGSVSGGQLDKASGFIHLSQLHQVSLSLSLSVDLRGGMPISLDVAVRSILCY